MNSLSEGKLCNCDVWLSLNLFFMVSRDLILCPKVDEANEESASAEEKKDDAVPGTSCVAALHNCPCTVIKPPSNLFSSDSSKTNKLKPFFIINYYYKHVRLYHCRLLELSTFCLFLMQHFVSHIIFFRLCLFCACCRAVCQLSRSQTT